MPINSGNKKVNNAFDQRAAASDNAQLAYGSGRIFNIGGGGGNATAAAQTSAETPKLLIVAVTLVVALTIWAIFIRK